MTRAVGVSTNLRLPREPVGAAVLTTWLVTAAWDFLCASALSVFAYRSTFSRLWQGVGFGRPTAGCPLLFTLTVIANFVAMTQGQPPAWVTYSPLFPLAFLLLSGLYLFVLPYATRWRSGRRASLQSGE